jgi:CRP-like cAMP-binding protein
MDEAEQQRRVEGAGDEDGGDAGAVDREARIDAAQATELNRLLRALPADEYASLRPRLTPARLRSRDTLIAPDAPIREVYFPRTGVVSIVAARQDGGVVEVITVGPEGVVGLPVVLGANRRRTGASSRSKATRGASTPTRSASWPTRAPPSAGRCCATRSTSSTACRSRSPATACTRSRRGPRAGC